MALNSVQVLLPITDNAKHLMIDPSKFEFWPPYGKENSFMGLLGIGGNSKRNVLDYDVLHRSQGLLFIVHPFRTLGCVYAEDELARDVQHVVPVMRANLRPGCFGYKKLSCLHLRIGTDWSNIFAQWLLSFVVVEGGVVCQVAELASFGAQFLAELLQVLHARSEFMLRLGDVTLEEILGDAEQTRIEQLTSKGISLANLVLILERSTG